MVRQEDEQRLLEFVEENEQVNTFRIARELRMERALVLKIIDQLQKKGAVDYQTGKVVFLSHPKKESVTKIASPSLPIKKIASSQKKVNPMMLLVEQSEKLSEKNKQLKQQFQEAYEQVKELAQYKKMAGDHSAQIETLKSQLEAAQKKAEKKPRIVEKVVVQKVPIPVKQKAKLIDVNWTMARDSLKKLQTKFSNVSLPDTFHKKLKCATLDTKSYIMSLPTKVKQIHIPAVFKK